MSKHLWEIDHDYYCESHQGNEYNSFDEFIANWWSSAFDCFNLLFRWDWVENEDNPYTGELRLFFYLQRKGKSIVITIKVSRSDEPEVIKFLTQKLEYLMELWSPLTDTKEGEK